MTLPSRKPSAKVTSYIVEAGQEPYGPHYREAIVVFKIKGYRQSDGFVPLYVDIERAKRAFALLEQGWDDESHDEYRWRLVYCQRLEPSDPDPDGSKGLGAVAADLSDQWQLRVERFSYD